MSSGGMLTESYWPASTDGPELRPELTVGGLLREAAADSADAEALIEGLPDPGDRRRWTYAELLADAERCAHFLLEHFEPGERVAIWAPNSPEWVIAEYAAGLAGLVVVTVNPSLQPEEVKYVLGQSESAGVLVVPDARGNPLMAHLDKVRPDLPALRTVLRLDALLTDATGAGDADDPAGLPHVTGDDIAQIQYTSGTTGFPKGVMLSHASIANNAACWVARLELPAGASWVTPMPLFHTGGCVLGVLGSITQRSPLVLMPGFDPALMLQLVEDERCHYLAGVPTMLIALMDHPKLADYDLSSLKSVLSGGAQVPEALVRRIEETLGVDFTIVYGQTECSPAITNTSPHDTAVDKGQTIGQPLPHTEVKVVDESTLETVAVDAPGELWTRGYLTMSEYYNKPDETAATLLDDGWLRTGDLATMDGRGYLRIVGRLKDMIIRGGENLFPAEIEEVLISHPKVAEVAVIGIPDEKWGEVVGAVIRPGTERPTSAELRAFTRERLSPQKTPTVWLVADDFPLTGSGKIRKNVLRDRVAAGDTAPLN